MQTLSKILSITTLAAALVAGGTYAFLNGRRSAQLGVFAFAPA